MGITELVVITLIVELIELYLQYSSTLKESLFKLYSYYQKSPFIFYASNIGYIWLLFITIAYSKYNFAMLLAIVLKSFDIFTKLTLIDKIFVKQDRRYIDEISTVIESKVPVWIYLIGPMTYPYIIYIAFL